MERVVFTGTDMAAKLALLNEALGPEAVEQRKRWSLIFQAKDGSILMLPAATCPDALRAFFQYAVAVTNGHPGKYTAVLLHLEDPTVLSQGGKGFTLEEVGTFFGNGECSEDPNGRQWPPGLNHPVLAFVYVHYEGLEVSFDLDQH